MLFQGKMQMCYGRKQCFMSWCLQVRYFILILIYFLHMWALFMDIYTYYVFHIYNIFSDRSSIDKMK